jgi:DNA mismatch repair protein MutL
MATAMPVAAHRIQVLKNRVANQIAAGEVIERPASIVKELLENALDAGATRIQIELEKAGINLIRITDNGCGIVKDDLALALKRHATSKIQDVTDLNHLQTLGFRGEALASICSVAKTTLISKPAHQQTAWQVTVSGLDMDAEILPAAHADGSTIEVRDLFYNTPARRRFLRSDRTELLQIEDVINRIALSRYDIAMTVKHNEKKILQFSAATQFTEQERRIKAIFGQTFLNNCVHLDSSASQLHLRGWISTADFNRSQTDCQFFYLNQRIIKDKVINHAIRQAYQDILFAGKHPAYVLYLDIEPEEIDVNVHPAKYEVRFHQSRLVHDFLISGMQNALQQTSSQLVNEEQLFVSDEPLTSATPQHAATTSAFFSHVTLDRNKARIREQDRFYQQNQAQLKENRRDYLTDKAEQVALILPHTEQDDTSDVTQSLHYGLLGDVFAIFQQTFILSQAQNDLWVINLHMAFQAQLWWQLQAACLAQRIIRFPLLIPPTLTVSSSVHALFLSYQTVLADCGIVISSLSPHAIILRELPTALKASDEQTVLSQVQHYLVNLTQSSDFQATALYLHLALHSKSKEAIQNQQAQQILRIIEQIEQQQVKHHFPGLYAKLSLADLENLCQAS